MKFRQASLLFIPGVLAGASSQRSLVAGISPNYCASDAILVSKSVADGALGDFKSNPVTVVYQDYSTVRFKIDQNWVDDDLGWLSVGYTPADGSSPYVCDLTEALNDAAATTGHTAKCLNGFASIDVFVSDCFFDNIPGTIVPADCAPFGADLEKVAKFNFLVPCDPKPLSCASPACIPEAKIEKKSVRNGMYGNALSNPVNVLHYGVDTVLFRIEQNWKHGDLGFISVNYEPADSSADGCVSAVEVDDASSTEYFIAKCNGGVAKVDVYAFDFSFTDVPKLSPAMPDSCKPADDSCMDDGNIVHIQYSIPCDVLDDSFCQEAPTCDTQPQSDSKSVASGAVGDFTSMPIAITRRSGSEVEFKVFQTIKDGPMGWIAVNYPVADDIDASDDGKLCEYTQKLAAGGSTAAYTAACTGGVAVVDVYAYDCFFTDVPNIQVPDMCQPSVEPGKKVHHRFTLPCLCEEPDDPVIPDWDPKVTIENVVYTGDATCADGTKLVGGYINDPVTYCFKVTNIGNTHLKTTNVKNDDVDFDDTHNALIPPGESFTFTVDRTLDGDYPNVATVVAVPATPDGKQLTDLGTVTASDDSAIRATFKPLVSIDNVVYKGDGTCEDGTESAKDFMGSDVTYCFTVTNTGSTDLKNLKVTNDDITPKFEDTYEEVLLPGESYTLVVTSKFDGEYNNTAVVNAQPVKPDGTPINADNPTAQDDSGILLIEALPAVKIDNVVFAGDGTCADGTDLVNDFESTNITYCFKVTNTGNTYLTNLDVVNNDLPTAYSNSYNLILGPSESYLLTVRGTIDGEYNNTAVVVGKPVLADGTPLENVENPTDDDDSGIKPLAAGDVRNGQKSPFDFGLYYTDKCLEDNWKEVGMKDTNLVCRAKEVSLSNISSSLHKTCRPGEKILVDLSAIINFNTTVDQYDFGWYIATDGGNALTGNCSIKSFEQGQGFDITDASISWDKDAIGGSDVCGDITFLADDAQPAQAAQPARGAQPGRPQRTSGAVGPAQRRLVAVGTGASLEISLGNQLELTCADVNDDGFMDFSICFTWRTADKDETCDPMALYPGIETGCDCMTYDIPEVTVKDPDSHSTCV